MNKTGNLHNESQHLETHPIVSISLAQLVCLSILVTVTTGELFL